MAGFGNKVKLTMLKGMEAVGQRASSMASSAQQKLQELNLETQRREILSEFPLRAYDLWQKGEQLPEPLAKMMADLGDLDERLGVLRAQRYAKVEEAKKAAGEQAPTAGDETVAEPQDGEAAGDVSADVPADGEAAGDAPADAPRDGEPAGEQEPTTEDALAGAPADGETAFPEEKTDGETGGNA